VVSACSAISASSSARGDWVSRSVATGGLVAIGSSWRAVWTARFHGLAELGLAGLGQLAGGVVDAGADVLGDGMANHEQLHGGYLTRAGPRAKAPG
jgi:hypothetical protein